MRAAGLARAATLTWESSATGLLDVLARVVRQRRSTGLRSAGRRA